MWLSPRLAWRRHRLRNQPVPRDGRPLSDTEHYLLGVARLALIDEEGTRRVAVEEEGAEMLAADENGDWG